MSTTIHVAYDDEGKILAAVAASAGEQGPKPTEGPGVSVGQFEVPAKFAGKKLIDYVDLLRVEAKGLAER
jgi:hypothetical protein